MKFTLIELLVVVVSIAILAGNKDWPICGKSAAKVFKEWKNQETA